MSVEEKKLESASTEAGRSDELVAKGPSANLEGTPSGQPTKEETKKATAEINLDNYVEKTRYSELEKKLSEQGKELGEHRTYLKEINPVLEQLKDAPELVEAIIDGKIDTKLAQAVLDGKVKVEDAETVAKAHEEVKEKLGNEKYQKASPEEIEKMIKEEVEKKVGEKSKELHGVIEKDKMIRSNEKFQQDVAEFIQKTPDYPEYADEIKKFFDEHPDIYEMEVAYNAVKGRVLSGKIAEEEKVKAAENAKELAGAAAGGLSQGKQIDKGESALIDSLVAPRSNPNYL